MTWTVTITIADEKAAKSRTRFYWDGSADFSTVEDYARQFCQKVDSLISGHIIDVSITRSVNTSSWALSTLPEIGSDVEEKMVTTYRTMSERRFSLTVPTWRQEHVQRPGMYMNLLDPDVLEWANFVVQSYLDANYNHNIVDSRNDEILTRTKSAFKFRKHGKTR